MSSAEHMVYVVDDDPQVCMAVEELLQSCGLQVSSFGSASHYMESPKPEVPSCLVLDIELPDINGLDLQVRLAGERPLPIVFISGHGDIASTVRAMKAGAVDFLPKPFSPGQLLSAIEAALAHDAQQRAAASELRALQVRYASLTPREREVLPLIVRGLLNKQAAAELGISGFTFQIHRSSIMRKMDAGSLSDLVRMSIRLGVSSLDG